MNPDFIETVNGVKEGIVRWVQRPENLHYVEMMERNDWVMCVQQDLPDMLFEDMEAVQWLYQGVCRGSYLYDTFEAALHLVWADLNDMAVVDE